MLLSVVQWGGGTVVQIVVAQGLDVSGFTGCYLEYTTKYLRGW